MLKKLIDNLPQISSEPLDRMAEGYRISQVLFTAIDYDIFTLLEKSKTAEQVSNQLKTNPNLTEKFLNALVALKLLSKDSNKYFNTKLAETYLVKGAPFYQGNLFKLRAGGYADCPKLAKALRGGGITGRLRKGFGHIDEVFTLGHAEGSLRGGLQRAVKAVASLDEFRKAKKLLDLGGGHGLYAIAFGQLNPHLDIFLFDLPQVTKISKKFIQQYKQQKPIQIIPGDFTKDDIGDGYDIIFASDVTITSILKKIYEALNHKGILIYRRWVLDDDKTGPLTSVLFDLMLAIRGSEHRLYSLEEYVHLLEGANFSVTQVLDLSTPTDPSKILIAKKEE